MSDTLKKRAIDMLFKIKNLDNKYHEINKSLSEVDADIPVQLFPVNSKLMGELLGLFDSILGEEGLSVHFLYDTGEVTVDGETYDLNEREDFIYYLLEKK